MWYEISVGHGHGSTSSDLSAHQEEMSSLKLEIAIAKKLTESADLIPSSPWMRKQLYEKRRNLSSRHGQICDHLDAESLQER